MNRPTKRQRRENPKSWLHNHSLACVATSLPQKTGSSSSDPVIRTPVSSAHTKEVFLERLEKEIIIPLQLFRGKKARGKRLKDHAPAVEKERAKADEDPVVIRSPWPKQIVIGTNQCTRILEKAINGIEEAGDEEAALNSPKPCLVVLARDIYPPTILSHVPVLAEQILQQDGKTSLPILLLPGRASKELGQALGPKNVSVIVFLEEAQDATTTAKAGDDVKGEQERQAQATIASFVKFVKKNLL